METQHVDVTIIGAGPAGLCLARALSGLGLRVLVLERQPEDAVRTPAFDGREIALTHRSRALMQQFDLWRRLPDLAAPQAHAWLWLMAAGLLLATLWLVGREERFVRGAPR